MMSLEGRRYLVTGLLTTDSISWHVASALLAGGAEVALTSYGRAARLTAKAARRLPSQPEIYDLDAADETAFERLAGSLRERWGRLDGALHSIAFAPPDAIGGGFVTATADNVWAGFQVSAYSLQRLAGSLASLLSESPHGGSVVGITVDSARALPGYDWMGVYKAALESTARYLALHLGPSGIRTNLVAAGPLDTVSARGVSTFEALADHYEKWAPLGWDRAHPDRLVGAVLFLLSDLSRWTSGQVVYVDGGMHAVAGGIGEPPPRRKASQPDVKIWL